MMTPVVYSANRNDGFFPSIFNDFFGEKWLMPKSHGTTPAINVYETEQGYQVDVAAPGMNKEDFSISLDNDGDLVIRMEKKSENKEEGKDAKKYLRREFSYSKFEQRLALPDHVEKQNISAKMADGVLSIDIPKMTEVEKAEETHYIEIK